MRKVVDFDSADGHAVGWDPNGVTTMFTITEPALNGAGNDAFVSVILRGFALNGVRAALRFPH